MPSSKMRKISRVDRPSSRPSQNSQFDPKLRRKVTRSEFPGSKMTLTRWNSARSRNKKGLRPEDEEVEEEEAEAENTEVASTEAEGNEENRGLKKEPLWKHMKLEKEREDSEAEVSTEAAVARVATEAELESTGVEAEVSIEAEEMEEVAAEVEAEVTAP